MKLGIFTALFQDRPLEEVLRLAADLDYEAVELPAWKGSPHLDLEDVLADGGRRLLGLVRRYGLEISALSARASSCSAPTIGRWSAGRRGYTGRRNWPGTAPSG